MNNWLKEKRNKTGLTQVQVADRANISERYYQEIEAGYIPSVPVAKRIAILLGFKWELFYEDDDTETA